MTVFEQKAAVVRNDSLAPNTFLMELECPAVASAAKPGQFVMLRVSEGIDPLLRRPFSICNTRNGRNLLLLYRVVGKGTRIMAETRAGSRFSVLGPLGKGFTPPEKGEDCFLVGGGMGIAPLVLLADSLQGSRISFFAGYGTAAEIVSLERLGVRDVDTSVATDDGSQGFPGVVTDLLASALMREGEKVVYGCGPAAMLKRVATLCAEHRTACQVSLETVMACGLGACRGCTLPSAPNTGQGTCHACEDGPVFLSSAIDWENL